MQQSSAATSQTADPRWLAPEALARGRVMRASDVYSFAMVMWEMLTWQEPYAGMSITQVIVQKALLHDVRPWVPPRGLLPGMPPPDGLETYDTLMRQCWAQTPSDR